ncbi:Myelin protein zero-like protein 3 [Takifugu flavidus]|uniref:Myelin protein zero-like protein 3 n=1 Tax=Takifugu flavidus TaxID=433684 RepID=A0A5C6PEU0_9TELE|nr:Myelin protein zero-like protein 3 [Takifugu flavidus]
MFLAFSGAKPPSHGGMCGSFRGRSTTVRGLLFWLLALSPVSSIFVNTPAELQAFKGEAVMLSCTFTSSNTPTSKMSVDWSYRPQTGGPPQNFFHFSSQVFLPPPGQFFGRIRWQGTPARGDASISLINATLNDNGTYTCSVRNPPDVHGSPSSHTVLTVTPKAPSIRFSDVTVLLVFILLPSTIIMLFLIGRMVCSKKMCCRSAQYRSSIEVTKGELHDGLPPPGRTKMPTCCDLYLMTVSLLCAGPEDEDEYYHLKKNSLVDQGYAESQL